MLQRPRIALCSALAVAALAVFAVPAHAQDAGDDYPGTTVTTAAQAVCTVTVTAAGNLVAGAAVVVSGTCNNLEAGVEVDGTLLSTPIDLPTVTVIGHTASFPVTLPASWDVKAFHTLKITDADTGELLLNGKFYVDGTGKIAAAPDGDLPRTGSSSTGPITKAGVVLLAAGAGATVVARKRRRSTAAAG